MPEELAPPEDRIKRVTVDILDNELCSEAKELSRETSDAKLANQDDARDELVSQHRE
jgi:hypothetical protein